MSLLDGVTQKLATTPKAARELIKTAPISCCACPVYIQYIELSEDLLLKTMLMQGQIYAIHSLFNELHYAYHFLFIKGNSAIAQLMEMTNKARDQGNDSLVDEQIHKAINDFRTMWAQTEKNSTQIIEPCPTCPICTNKINISKLFSALISIPVV